jgi:hypothetical protein
VKRFKKSDLGKSRLDLVPPRALELVGLVLAYGAKKYEPGNWARIPRAERWRYVAAPLRHVTAYMRGERLDPESGLPHLAHAACSLLFLLDLEAQDKP